MVMGTASTMAVCAEVMGMMLPGGATAPAVTAGRLRLAEMTGSRAVAIGREGLTPDKVLDRRSITNAYRALMAIGGSTNAVVHLSAIAGRLGMKVPLDEVDRLGQEMPMVVNLNPSGTKYMQELDAAGAVPALLDTLADRFHLEALTIAGSNLGEAVKAHHKVVDRDTIYPADTPLKPKGAVAVLFGNLAPYGAVIKESAAGTAFLNHTGRAVVFDGLADMMAQIDSDDLDVSPDDVLIMRGIGPAVRLVCPKLARSRSRRSSRKNV